MVTVIVSELPAVNTVNGVRIRRARGRWSWWPSSASARRSSAGPSGPIPSRAGRATRSRAYRCPPAGLPGLPGHLTWENRGYQRGLPGGYQGLPAGATGATGDRPGAAEPVEVHGPTCEHRAGRGCEHHGGRAGRARAPPGRHGLRAPVGRPNRHVPGAWLSGPRGAGRGPPRGLSRRGAVQRSTAAIAPGRSRDRRVDQPRTAPEPGTDAPRHRCADAHRHRSTDAHRHICASAKILTFRQMEGDRAG
jgi:hypothetical protein